MAGSVVVNHDPVASTSGTGRKIRPESDCYQGLVDPMGRGNVLNDGWIKSKQLYGSIFNRVVNGSFHEYHLSDILQEGRISHYVKSVGKTMVFPHWTPWEKVVTGVFMQSGIREKNDLNCSRGKFGKRSRKACTNLYRDESSISTEKSARRIESWLQ